jgi:hypothetical protein
VNAVVLPAARLLDADSAPLSLRLRRRCRLHRVGEPFCEGTYG